MTRSMVLLPMKSISTQSGKALAAASFQPPPLPQPAPLRSLLLIAATGNCALDTLAPSATAPALASATLVPPEAVLITWSKVLLVEAALPASPLELANIAWLAPLHILL